ncbi:hypothetical protein OS493_040519, partial [Desmophyllum pertusum]
MEMHSQVGGVTTQAACRSYLASNNKAAPPLRKVKKRKATTSHLSLHPSRPASPQPRPDLNHAHLPPYTNTTEGHYRRSVMFK